MSRVVFEPALLALHRAATVNEYSSLLCVGLCEKMSQQMEAISYASRTMVMY
jgi:hypothetical protein